MGAATKPVDTKILQDLVPLNTLSTVRFSQLARNISIESVKADRYLFRLGDRDDQTIFLLDGRVNLVDANEKVTAQIESGTDISRYPLASQQPRTVSARTATKAVVARIDSSLLDAFLTWDESSCAEVVSIDADNNQDWMTRLLQSDAFRKISPAVLQRLLLQLRPVSVKAGEAVIRQGEQGGHFYCIHKGRCAVSRKSSDKDEEQMLAELSDGDIFGEEALVSDARRNATVTMLTDGVLMLLDKSDFIELLQKQLVRQVDFELAAQMVEKGAVWLDVRLPEEYAKAALDDSVNMPLASLREEMPELVFNAKYLICCDTGQRSATAAFVLSQKGFEVYVLKGGLDGLAGRVLVQSDQFDAAPLAAAGGTDAVSDAQEQHATPAQGPVSAPWTKVDGLGAEPAAQDEAENRYRELHHQLESLGSELAELQVENKTLRHEAGVHCESMVRMEVQEQQIEQLRQELGETSEWLADMRAQARAASEEKQSLQENLAALELNHTARIDELLAGLEHYRIETESLRTEIERASQAHRSHQEQFESVQTEQGAVVAVLQSDLQQAGQEIESLRANLGSVQDENEALQEQCVLADRLRDDLLQTQQRNEALESSVRLLEEEQSAGKEVHARFAEQLDLAETLREELAQSKQRITDLQAELDAARELVSASDEKYASLSGQEEEAKGLRDELEVVRARLEAEQICGQEMREQNRELQDSRDALEIEFQGHREQLRHELDATDLQRQSLEQALEESRQAHAHTRAQLTGAAADRDQSAALLQALQQENQALLEAQQQLETQLRVHNEQRETLTAAKQAADEALQRLQLERETDSAAQGEDADRQRQHIGELEVQLANAKESADAGKVRLEEELESLASRHGGEIEQREQRNGELQEELSRLAGELQAVAAARDALQVELDARREDAASRQQEIDALSGQLAALDDASGKEIAQVNEQLKVQEERAEQAQRLGEEKDRQLEALREELRARDEDRTRAELKLETQRRRLEEIQQEMLQMEERARADLQEGRESLGKAHRDLAKKNDIERGLQGQIERLRKKLEQTGSDLQEARESAREDLEILRSELNAERRARAGERSEMAARQRELKEQLAAVASEHEENLTGQSGMIAQARDDAREEERTRLMQDLKAQEETEKQLAALREELERSHNEMAEAIRREKRRYETDQKFAGERKDEAEAAISQLEIQVKQLALERDTAFEGQQALQGKLDCLRAEVEVARGLMGVGDHGRVEDPSSLRDELGEAKKDVEIAIRLRSESEVARDGAMRENRELRRKLDKLSSGSGTQHTSPFDELRSDGSPALHLKERASVAELAARPSAESGHSFAGADSELVVSEGDSVRHTKLVSVIALVLVGLAFWYLQQYWSAISVSGNKESLQMDQPPDGGPALHSEESAKRALAISGVKPSPGNGSSSQPQNPGRTAPQRRKPESTRSPTVLPDSGSPPVTLPATASEADTALADPQPLLTAVRRFRDMLQDGSRGPLMVELPRAGFLMGSGSNSLRFDERPLHAVELRGFSISKTEVTFSEYDRFARATGRRLPHDEGWGRKDRPVINVSWKDAMAYTRWLSAQTGKTYRLPSESEWEFAARAGTDTVHWWGSASGAVQANCFDCGSPWDGSRSAPVGSFPANGFGLHDSAGNVQEWTQDCYFPDYKGAPADGSARVRPVCTQRVVRGGAYTSPLGSLRSTRRGQLARDTRLDNLGFRIVREN